jgi:hypothetical protein
MKKNLLRQANLVFWHQTLINRFKKRTSQALSALQSSRYTMTDAKFEKDSRLFAQNIFRSTKTINMNSIHNQLTIAWNNLDWQFRANILESTTFTFIRKFLNQLNSMSNIWQEMTRSQSQNQFKSLRNRFQNSRRTQKYSEYFFRTISFSFHYQNIYSNNQFFFLLNCRSYNRQKYQNRDTRSSYFSQDNRLSSFDSRYFKKKPFVSVLSFSRQFLQIIDENANTSDFSFSETKSKNQYKSNKYSRNHKEKRRAYVIEKDHEHEMKNNSTKDEYYHESDSNLNYYNLQNENQNDELEVNFFTQTRMSTCRKCKKVFSFNNQLHKHLRQKSCENFNQNTNENLKNQTFDESSANLAMNMLIIEFSIDFSKNIDTEFEFWEWTYVKVMISLSIKNNETQIVSTSTAGFLWSIENSSKRTRLTTSFVEWLLS